MQQTAVTLLILSSAATAMAAPGPIQSTEVWGRLAREGSGTLVWSAVRSESGCDLLRLERGGLAPELPLPSLRLVVEGSGPDTWVLARARGGWERVALQGGEARLPVGIATVRELADLELRIQGAGGPVVRIVAESPLALAVERRGDDVAFLVANWGEEATLRVLATDDAGRSVDLASAPRSRLQAGGASAFVLPLPSSASYPLRVEVALGAARTERVFYSGVRATGICATPGADGNGGVLAGVVNTYYTVTANVLAGATSIAVGSPQGATTPIAAGDLLLLVQMQDAQISSANSSSYGDGVAGGDGVGATALDQTGRYELVAALGGVVSGTVSIRGAGAGNGTLFAYTNAAATATRGQRTCQLIRVPQYATATISSALGTLAWDGRAGGVLAIDVAGQLVASGTVSVAGLGFRGGIGQSEDGPSSGVTNTDYRTPSGQAVFGMKGEGIAGTPREMPNANAPAGIEGYPSGDEGRGAPGNAGGGGNDNDTAINDENAGGGGGGNAGRGGRGGLTWQSEEDYGGHGGAAFAGAADRIITGAGGGAGSSNNAGPSHGAPGGGLVIIRAGNVVGSGTIDASGGGAPTSDSDASGGGGAGGTVLVEARNGNLAALAIVARGGAGGDSWPTLSGAAYPGNRHGPGGGGGGGKVLLSATPWSSATTPGANGTTTTYNDHYGSTPGQSGVVDATITASQLPGIDSGATCSPDTDGDGIPDTTEGGNDDDGDGLPNYLDLDSDNDGVLDSVEGAGDTDRDGIPDYLDLDSDNDGVVDLVEGNDADGDGVNDNGSVVDADGDGRIDAIVDADDNGVDDSYDTTPAAHQDSDGDGLPDRVDVDDDGDGTPTILEDPNFNGDRSDDDSDGDGVPDYLDPDTENRIRKNVDVGHGMPVMPGQTLTYTVTVTNPTSVPWTGLSVTDPVPAGTSYVAGSSQRTIWSWSSTNYRDEITSSTAYNGSNGTTSWTSVAWLEFGDDQDSANGDLRIQSDGGSNRLRVREDDNSLVRPVNLAGYSSALLSYVYRRSNLGATDVVVVEVSGNGGGSWTELARYQGVANDAGYLSASFDISSHATTDTHIRLRSISGASSTPRVYFDDIDIVARNRTSSSGAGSAPPTLATGLTLQPGETIVFTYQVVVDNPLPPGVTAIVNQATFTTAQTPAETGSVTNPVGAAILRNDEIASLGAAAAAMPGIFAGPAGPPSLDLRGPNSVPTLGEGAAQQTNGSSDDDDFYEAVNGTTYVDPDPTVLADPSRPLVFYEVDRPVVLTLRKVGGLIELSY